MLPFRLVQPKNMLDELVTRLVFQPSAMEILVSAEQPLNMLLMLVTLPVENNSRLRATSAEQPWNMPLMLVTLLTSTTSRYTFVSDEQSLNMLLMSVTFEVSHAFEENEVRLVHPSNIPLMLVTSLALRYSTSMVVSCVIP